MLGLSSKASMSDSKTTKAAAKSLRLSHNKWSNKYFAIAIGAIMVLFAICHWSSVIYFHYGPKKSNPALTRKYRYAGLSHVLSTILMVKMRQRNSTLSFQFKDGIEDRSVYSAYHLLGYQSDPSFNQC
jgi:hypothetical protein